MWNPQVREVVLAGFRDPYFEVRSSAAQSAIFFSDQIGEDPEIMDALKALMLDRDFEVAREGILAMGRVAKDPA